MQNGRRGKSGCAACRRSRVVLHPGGFAARRWRVEHYHSLVRELHRKGVGVVLTGSQTEADMFNQQVISDQPLPASVLNLMGQLSVRELMAVIAASHAVVSGATGPAHIAAACAVPNISLFDPRRAMIFRRDGNRSARESSCVQMYRLAKNVSTRPVPIGTVSTG